MDKVKKIYLDLDDTVKDTEKYIRRVLSSNGVNEKSIEGTIYRLIGSGTFEGQIVENCLKSWSVIPFKSCAETSLKLLQTEYDVVFCSAYTFNKEALYKQAFAKKLGCGIILCGKGYNYKDHVDMSDGIFIDDRSDILLRSNAVAKFEMYNPYMFDIYAERDDRTLVVDWFSLVGMLLSKNGEEGSVSYEDYGRLFCQGVQA